MNERDVWRNNGWKIFKINSRHQIIDSGNSDNNKQDKYQNIPAYIYHIQLKKKERKSFKRLSNQVNKMLYL